MPPGRLNGVPAILTSRRCSWYDAATHSRYSSSADTFAITTSRSNDARNRERRDNHRVQHDRQRRRAIARMHAHERRRQHAVARQREQGARRAQHVARDVSENRHGHADEKHQLRAVAEQPAGGLGERRILVKRQLGTQHALRDGLHREIDRCRDRQARSGSRAARFCAGSRISPDGVSATSTPTNAKSRTIDACPTCDTVGSDMRRNSEFSDQTPATTSNSSGISFAAVMTSTSRMPGLMPRTLTAASAANSNRRSKRANGSAARRPARALRRCRQTPRRPTRPRGTR